MFSSPFKRRIAVIVIVVALTVGQTQAITLYAQRDTYVSSAVPNIMSNYSGFETLNVSAQSTAFVGFDLSGLPLGIKSSQIATAKLFLWVDKASPAPSGSFRVVPVTSPWDGPAMTYVNRPTYPLTSPTTTTISGGRNFYLEVDATDIVKEWVDKPASNNGLALFAASSAIDVMFDSKENTSTSHPALLDITITSGKTVAICLNADNHRLCSCTGKTLSVVYGGSCAATSDSGPCSAVQAGMASNNPIASCCVCAP
jgi:hypothetical protein